ncbi:Ig-like domain-containing protein [Vibrio mediterranei]|uniref:Ig-like domain-containing protein n=1 Tax=Vibrio mediterranei TaxID=689 RepID=UPI002284385E|nr:Ig-like domain-containing protein [Vibrio mediterranei]MCY9855813.1 Ig-like domain-containing protein [Vibrio mediterranei]
MTGVFLHGVDTVESLSGTVSVVEVSSSVIAIFGTSEKKSAGNFYHTTGLKEAEAEYGEGTILKTLRRIHSYVEGHSVIGFPLGKDSDFSGAKTVLKPAFGDVSFSSSTATIAVADGQGSPVQVHNPKSKTLTYTSSEVAHATVDAHTGVVTPVAAGSTTIEAAIDGGGSVSYTLNVTAANANSAKTDGGGALSASELHVYVGNQAQAVTVINPHSQVLSYQSDDTSVATVDANTGKVTPLSAGSAVITVTLAEKVDGVTTYFAKTLSYNLTVELYSDTLLAAFKTALPLLRKTRQRLGFFPKINLAPGILNKPGAAGLAVNAVRGIRGQWYGDVPHDVTDVDGAYRFKQNFADQRMVWCWPPVKVINKDGAQEVMDLATSIAGLTAQVDKNLTGDAKVATGYWCSASNYVLPDVVGPSVELDYIPNDADCDVNRLNASGIVTVMNRAGWRAFGNYSSAYPENNDMLSFVSWRRSADVIEESIEYFTLQWLDKPMFTGPTDFMSSVAGRVRDSINDYLAAKVGTSLVAFNVSILPKDNPITELMKGNVTVRYKITPPVPMQTVEYQAVINPQGLEEAFKQLVGGSQ